MLLDPKRRKIEDHSSSSSAGGGLKSRRKMGAHKHTHKDTPAILYMYICTYSLTNVPSNTYTFVHYCAILYVIIEYQRRCDSCAPLLSRQL